MDQTLTALVVEDEPAARRRLGALLAERSIGIVATAASGAEAVRLLRQHTPDVVFLDVHLGDMTAMDVLAGLDEHLRPLVVFATAHEEHALRAFDFAAVDYLLKPITEARVDRAVERVRAALAGAGGPPSWTDATPGRWLRRIAIRQRGRVELVPVGSIDWLEAADVYVRLHCGGRDHLVRDKMSDLEAGLDPGRFLRVHRSAIVNKERVSGLRRRATGGYELVLLDGTRIGVARGRRGEVRQALAIR